MSCPFSLTDPATIEDPYPFYRWMLEEEPVHFDAGLGMYVVAGYDLIRKVALDTQRFSNEQAQLNQWNHRPGGMPAEAMAILDAAVPQVPMLVTADPPGHKRSRVLVQLAFTPPRVARMRAYIEEIVDSLIDRFQAQGTVEFISAFAMPLPVTVISDQLGVPRSEFARVKAWSDAVVGLRGLMGTDAEIIRDAGTLVDFQTYFGDLIAARRARGPAEADMLDDLINARLGDERPLDHAELISTLQQLLVAGNESTTGALASGMMLLLRDGGEIPRLKADEARLRRFVDEVLRLEPPVQGNLRRAVVDAEIGGVAIPKGALIQLRHAAGNRDARAFPKPESLDLDAAQARPHLAFGFGAHLCIGNALAREEMFIAFRTLLDRLPNLAFAPDLNDFRHNRSIYIRGLKALHLTFDPPAP